MCSIDKSTDVFIAFTAARTAITTILFQDDRTINVISDEIARKYSFSSYSWIFFSLIYRKIVTTNNNAFRTCIINTSTSIIWAIISFSISRFTNKIRDLNR